MPTPPDARRIAASVLTAVLNQGMFATATLDRALRADTSIDPRDKALATEIVYGTLRTRGFLEAQLQKLAARKLPRSTEPAHAHLLVAAYQLSFLDRVPAFAVVDAAVTAVSEAGGKQLGGFANAILRRLAQAPKANLDDALLQSASPWLLDALRDSVGNDATRALLGCSTAEDGSALTGGLNPPPCLRSRSGAPVPEWLEESARGQLCPDAFLVPKLGDLQKRPEWHDGHYIVQEEGAMFAGRALGARPGETILDSCAGRGQKSSLIAEALTDTGHLWATDVTDKKLAELRAEFARLHLPKPQTEVVDWVEGPVLPAGFPGHFDRILIDAPCTGTGTLRHRPEIALRLQPSDVDRLASNSERLLRHIANIASPQTFVLFVVCSVLRRECETVVENVSDVFELTPFQSEHPLLRDQRQCRLLPHQHGSDGFYLAALRRR